MLTLFIGGFFFFFCLWRQFTFNVIVKQVLGLTAEEPRTREILQDFLAFMRGLISFPLYIPGTPYAKAVQVFHIHLSLPLIISSYI